LKVNWNQLESIENQLKLKVIKLKSIEDQLIQIEKSIEINGSNFIEYLVPKKINPKVDPKTVGGGGPTLISIRHCSFQTVNWPFFYGITPTLPKIQGNEKLKPPISKAPGSPTPDGFIKPDIYFCKSQKWFVVLSPCDQWPKKRDQKRWWPVDDPTGAPKILMLTLLILGDPSQFLSERPERTRIFFAIPRAPANMGTSWGYDILYIYIYIYIYIY